MRRAPRDHKAPRPPRSQTPPHPRARSYGRGTERGTARPEVLQGLLETCERVVQQVDSVEYGLTDIQVRNRSIWYYQNILSF